MARLQQSVCTIKDAGGAARSRKSISQERLGALLFYGARRSCWLILPYLIVSPTFLALLAWAAVLVVLTYPVYERLARRTGATSAAAITTVGVLLVIMVPLIFSPMIAFVLGAFRAVHTLQFKFEGGHFAAVANLCRSACRRDFPPSAQRI